MKSYYVYFVTNWNNKVMYIGVTNDLERRNWEHKLKIFPGFTEKYNVFKLVYCEEYSSIDEAIHREKQLKRWRREKKDTLVNSMNPTWQDLAQENLDPSTSLGMTKKPEDDTVES